MEETKEMPSKQKHNKLLYIFILVLIAVCGYAFYSTYWTKTPAYSLKVLRNAVNNHDSAQFEKSVNLHQLCSSGADDILDYTIGIDMSNNQSTSPFIKAMLGTVKNALMPEMLSQSRNFVESGKYRQNNPALNGPMPLANPLEKYAGLPYWEFQGTGTTTKHDDYADVEVKIYDNQVGQSFTLLVRMQVQPDKSWQVTQVLNLRDYLKSYEAAKETKLKAVNADTSQQIKASIEVGTPIVPTIKTADDTLFSERVLSLNIPLVIHTNKALVFVGKIMVYDKDNNLIASHTVKDAISSGNKGKTLIGNPAIELNPFLTRQRKLMETDLSSLKLSYTITNITFADGIAYALTETLPTIK